MAEEKAASAKKEQPAKEKEPKEKSEAAAAGQKKTMFWGIIGGFVVLEVILMYFIIGLTRPKEKIEVSHETSADSANVSMEYSTEMGQTTKPVEVITNVAGTEGDRFLKCVFVLEYNEPAGEKAKKGGGHGGEGEAAKSKTLEELDRRMPKFKNVLIDLLSSKTLTELNEPNTKEMIRKDLIRNINSSLPVNIGKVTDVLFQQFIIQ